jgi:hypothetical protein
MILAARGETQHAASLALLDDGGVRESSQYARYSFVSRPCLRRKSVAIRRTGFHHGLLAPRRAITPRRHKSPPSAPLVANPRKRRQTPSQRSERLS